MPEGTLPTQAADHCSACIAAHPTAAVRRTGTFFCVDKSVTAVVIKVRCMQEHMVRLSPWDVACLKRPVTAACRALQSTRMSWGRRCAPAVTMMIRSWRLSRDSGTAPVSPCGSARCACSAGCLGYSFCLSKEDSALSVFPGAEQECHCMLFLTEDNSFRGEDTSISLEEVVEATKGMSGVQP